MKLKHVFLSSLFLSTAFVACTNEDFTEISSPANTKDAIALGEGYTIVGAKNGNDANTRAIFGEGFKATFWEKTDVVGAAWYNMITGFNADGTVATVANAFAKKFASNTWFKWSEQVGNDMSSAKFKSDANAMAGAYVLYFPYNEKITASVDAIPVELATNQTMDCKAGNELNGVNKNMFAYTVYPFVPGGAQTAEFKMNQLTNVFAIKFQVNKPELMVLEKPVQIAKVILEAKNSGSTVLRSKGGITPSATTVTADSYNKSELGEAVFGYSGLTENADHIILSAENATDDYSIKALKTPTAKPFYFSALPFSDAADGVTVKILTSDGKVYSKEYTAGAVLTAINNLATKEGKLVELTVTLDALSDEGTIYTAEQFKTKWNAAIEAEKATTLNIGEGVDLSDVDLSLSKASANITLKGKAAKIKSLNVTNGSLTIENSLEVVGDVTIGSNAKGFTTEGTGKLSVEGEINIQGTTGELAIAKMGKLNIDASGETVINGPADAKKSGIIANEGVLTLKSIKINTLTNAGSGKVTIADANVTNEGTITNEGEFDLGTNEFNNNGTFYQKDVVKGAGEFKNNAGAKLNVTANTQLKIANAAAADKKDAAVINVTGTSTATVKMTATASAKLTNNGVINLNAYSELEESADAAVTQTAGATINVAANATLTLEATTALGGGYVVVAKDGTVTNPNASDLIAFNITKAADITDAAGVSEVNTLFINTDLTITSTNVSSINDKNLVLNKNLVLENNLDMSSASVIIAGTVKITADATPRQFQLTGTDNTINKGASLTLGENVTLQGEASSKLKALGSLIAGEGTITAPGSTGLTIEY